MAWHTSIEIAVPRGKQENEEKCIGLVSRPEVLVFLLVDTLPRSKHSLQPASYPELADPLTTSPLPFAHTLRIDLLPISHEIFLL